MTEFNAILDAHTAAAASALAQAGTQDRWWSFGRHQCDMFAQNHSWAATKAHITDPRLRLRVAHARVLRGEDMAGQDLSPEVPADCVPNEAPHWAVPLHLHPWESEHWNPGLLTRYHDGGSGGTPGCFPPQRSELPILLAANTFHGQIGTVDSLLEYELSNWIPRVTTVHGTLDDAVAHQITIGECGHSKTSVRAGFIDFASAYPALLRIFGGDGAYGKVSESLGRLEVWRLLGALAGSIAPGDIDCFVNRTRCLTWQDPCDEIWYLHLALEDPRRGVSWVLDGQDFD